MSHPRDLLSRVQALLEREYPAGEHTYAIEKSIPGTRFYPDIAVLRAGQIVCAVEIGYTRPEKLTAYRDRFGIPDVRWYDKQGVLHQGWGEKVMAATVQVSYAPPSAVHVYRLEDQVYCADCIEELVPDDEKPDRDPDTGETWTAAEWDRFLDDAWSEGRAAVTTFLLTDYVRAWLPSFCDKCGRLWLADEANEATEVLQDLDHALSPRGDLRQFGESRGPRQAMSWEAAWAHVKQEIGFDEPVVYQDGYPLSDLDFSGEVRHAVHDRMAGMAIKVQLEGAR